MLVDSDYISLYFVFNNLLGDSDRIPRSVLKMASLEFANLK